MREDLCTSGLCGERNVSGMPLLLRFEIWGDLGIRPLFLVFVLFKLRNVFSYFIVSILIPPIPPARASLM